MTSVWMLKYWGSIDAMNWVWKALRYLLHSIVWFWKTNIQSRFVLCTAPMSPHSVQHNIRFTHSLTITDSGRLE